MSDKATDSLFREGSQVAFVTLKSLESLARALYETAAGTNGYRPLHETFPWEEIAHKQVYRDRAKEIIAKAGA